VVYFHSSGLHAREYTKEQIDQFIKDDQLTGDAQAVAERVKLVQKGSARVAEDEVESRQHDQR